MSLATRVRKLESRRRPVPRLESKAERDARVTAWGVKVSFVSIDMDLLVPNQAAAIRAAQGADT